MWKNLALVGASLPMNESHIDEHILGLVTHPLTKYWENALSLSGGIPSNICTMAGITIFVDRYIFGGIFPFIGQYHYISLSFWTVSRFSCLKYQRSRFARWLVHNILQLNFRWLFNLLTMESRYCGHISTCPVLLLVEAPSLGKKWQAKGFMDSGAQGAQVVTLLHEKNTKDFGPMNLSHLRFPCFNGLWTTFLLFLQFDFMFQSFTLHCLHHPPEMALWGSAQGRAECWGWCQASWLWIWWRSWV